MVDMEPFVVDLQDGDTQEVVELVSKLAAENRTVESREFLSRVSDNVELLPMRLRQGLLEFRIRAPSPVCVVRGYVVDDAKIGDTPRHWRERSDAVTFRHDLYFFLCASILGMPFAWSGKHDGYMMHNIVPIRDHDHQQMSSGSEVALTWHTEDAFHPLRADYLGLFCLRNPGAVETSLGFAIEIDGALRARSTLFEPRFLILPDDSRLQDDFRSAGVEIDAVHREKARMYMREMVVSPRPTALLSGDPRSPKMKLDQYYTRVVSGDAEAAEFLDAVVLNMNETLSGYALQPGEILFIDNYRAVHGREAFTPRYDGRDRWLRRLNIKRDLRGSRGFRLPSMPRLILL